MGAAILDRKSSGPPSWTGSDVKNAKVTPILLTMDFKQTDFTVLGRPTLECTSPAWDTSTSEYTVYSEIFARTLFSRNMRSFLKINPSLNDKISLSFINIGKFCLGREFFTSPICLLMLFAKISESTVSPS